MKEDSAQLSSEYRQHCEAILLSFLDEIPQLRKLSKELLLLGVRQLIKAACL